MNDFMIGKFFGDLNSIRSNPALDEQDMLRELEDCIDTHFKKYKDMLRALIPKAGL